MDAEINDSPSTLLRAIFRFHYNTQTIRTWSQPLHIPTSAFRPLTTIVPTIETTSTPYIMGKAHHSSHACSYIPNTMFLWLIIQLLMTIKPAHKIRSLTHRKCRGKPNIWILPPLLQKNKYDRSQLYRDQIFSHTIYLYNRKFGV